MSDGLRLGDHCDKIGSGATPRGGKEAYLSEGPYSLIRSQNVHNHGFEFSGLAYIDEEQARKLNNVAVREGDVLINITGDSVARACQVHPSVLPARVNQHVAIVRPRSTEIDPAFLRYWMVTPAVQAQLLGLASAGATRPALTKPMLEGLRVPAVPLRDQKGIATVLGSLDDKIELNRQMNETLEAMAQALFRDWFVDFGPTRRKIEGAADPVEIVGGLVTDAGRAQQLADLFPARFGDNGLPEGWGLRPLDESLVLQRGFDLPKANRREGAFPVIAASGFNGTHNEFKVKAPGVCTGRSGVLGNVFYVQEDFWPLNTSLWVKDYPNATPIYAYFLLREFDLHALNAGSAVPTLNRNHVHGRLIPKPPIEVVKAFTDVAALLMVRTETARQEAMSLGTTRDLLLPKLLSGEIRLQEAEMLSQAAE